MRLIEHYLFRQLLGPALMATAALGAVALLSQSLGTLDIIVEQRQSAVVFAKITLLAIPQLLSMILPIAIFVSSLIALNRLHTEQEIVVCFAGGMSRWRVISPAIKLASLGGERDRPFGKIYGQNLKAARLDRSIGAGGDLFGRFVIKFGARTAAHENHSANP